MPISQATRADLLLVLVTLIAAAGWLFSRESLLGMPPMLFMAARFLIAAALLLYLGRAALAQLFEPGRLLRVLALGVVMALALLSWILGLNSGTPLGEGAFITSMGVILVPLMSWLVLRERAVPAVWFSMPVAALGLGFLSLQHGFSIHPGQGWFFSSAVLFSLHYTLIGRFASRIPTLILTASQLLMVGLVSLLASLLFETWPHSLHGVTLGWLLASALLATSLRFSLQTRAQGMADPSHVAVIMVLEPVWVAIVGWLWYGEVMSLQQLTGCGLILVAMLIARWQGIRGLFFRA
ncbi:DMT family transporter [Granulosicoccaceae sp. 1_MG-2023]|nr:DMT family transporter [Granulosicoccaceae sp. 1_MG-2023]